MWFDRSARLGFRDPQKLQVVVPNRFVAAWIDRHFSTALREAANLELGHEVELDLQVDASQFSDHKPAGAEAIPDPSLTRSLHSDSPERPVAAADGHGATPASPAALARPASAAAHAPTAAAKLQRFAGTLRHKLEDFICGPSNELAYAAAIRLVDDADPHSPANPLFIHGGVGLGKTHLLQGICQRMLEHRPQARVLYTTGEQFTNDYIAAIRANRIEAWRKQIRRLDLLAVDDVHFMSNKQKTQQEFLHCFDAIDLSGARMVLASDNHPKLIEQFSAALVSRCMRGMVVEIKSPDTASRLAIVRALARRRGISLMETVVAVLASRCQGSVREIEGTLSKLHALANLLPAEESRDSEAVASGEGQRDRIGHVLLNRLFSLEQQSSPPRVLRMDDILGAVCEHMQVDKREVLGRGRRREAVLVRSLAIYLARQLTGLSYPEIAQAMGRQGHSTFVTAAGRIAQLVEKDAAVEAPQGHQPISSVITQLRQRLESHGARG